MTVCKKGRKNITHDKVRDEMYRKGLRISADKEETGMYAEDDPHRPGDVRVPGGGEDGMTQALDITIGDPTCATYLQAGSALVPLTAAKELHKQKMQKHRAVLRAVGGEPTFEFVPLTFEATGAMGPSTQKWWKGVMQIVKAREEGLPSSSNFNTRVWFGRYPARFRSRWRPRVALAVAFWPQGTMGRQQGSRTAWQVRARRRNGPIARGHWFSN